MPWKETCPMNERLQFIAAYQRRELGFAALCRTYGVSRKTGYKWIDRYASDGVDGLKERSRAPHHHPQAISRDLEEVILATRAQHPTWGPKKLVARLAVERPDLELPAASTAGEVLKRGGLVVPRKRRRHAPPRTAPLAHAEQPNAVWSIDFKGNFRTGDGQGCYPLTISDNASRYLLRCQVMTETTTERVRPLVEATFREYGLPQAIRSDNGPPFASVGLGGLSTLAVWWIKLGITPERIMPGKPEENGRHERMHRTLKQETAQPPQATLRAQQGAFDRFRVEYNTVRPHEALSQQAPASVYTPSPRSFPERLPVLEYPEADRVLRVRHNGEVYLRKQFIYVTAALAGEPVGLLALGPGQWELHFGPLVLGVLDESCGKVVPSGQRQDRSSSISTDPQTD